MQVIRGLIVAGILLVAGLFACGLSRADEGEDDQKRAEALSLLKRIAAEYDIRLDDARTATRVSQPAVRWTNSISGVTDAALFIWMHENRPVAVGSMVWLGDAGVSREFQSLSSEPLLARRGGKVAWNPGVKGIEFQPIPDAPTPAATARQRLSQMKELARMFRAEAVKGPPAYSEDSVWKFRLNPQPLLQYRQPDAPEREGAVFAFAMDTDPEVLLLIENRVRNGMTGWECGVAPVTGWSAKAWFGDELIWEQQRQHPAADPKLPYFVEGPLPVKQD
jgi:hypothetical protein